MIKKLSIFFAGYFVILSLLYVFATGDKFTPSTFGKWAMIITPIYILLALLIMYYKKPKK